VLPPQVVSELDTLCQNDTYMTDVCLPVFELICNTAMGCNATEIAPSDVVVAIKRYVSGNLYMVWVQRG